MSPAARFQTLQGRMSHNLIRTAAGGQGQVRQRADTLLKAPHSAERILRCWGHPQASFKTVQDSIIQLLQVGTSMPCVLEGFLIG